MQQMQQLKVVTPRWQTTWQITPLPDNSGFYLDGVTTDFWGTHDIAFTCPEKSSPSLAQNGSSSETLQKEPPVLAATFSLDPGVRGTAADLVSAVVADDLRLSGSFEPRLTSRSAKKAAPSVVSNRLTSKWEFSEGQINIIEDLPYIGIAFIFDRAANLPMRLLKFEATLNNDLIKRFVATCRLRPELRHLR